MQKQLDGRLFVHIPIRQTMCSTKGNAPVTGITRALDEVHTCTGKGTFSMESKSKRIHCQEVYVDNVDEPLSFQAVVFADYGWNDPDRDASKDDPARLETIILGMFPTFEEAKRACLNALRQVIDYIGFTVKTIANSVVQPLAA